jgi:hypothetical protein
VTNLGKNDKKENTSVSESKVGVNVETKKKMDSKTTLIASDETQVHSKKQRLVSLDKDESEEKNKKTLHSFGDKTLSKQDERERKAKQLYDARICRRIQRRRRKQEIEEGMFRNEEIPPVKVVNQPPQLTKVGQNRGYVDESGMFHSVMDRISRPNNGILSLKNRERGRYSHVDMRTGIEYNGVGSISHHMAIQPWKDPTWFLRDTYYVLKSTYYLHTWSPGVPSKYTIHDRVSQFDNWMFDIKRNRVMVGKKMTIPFRNHLWLELTISLSKITVRFLICNSYKLWKTVQINQSSSIILYDYAKIYVCLPKGVINEYNLRELDERRVKLLSSKLPNELQHMVLGYLFPSD